MEPITFLCLASDYKGLPFLQEAKRQRCHVILLVAEEFGNADWPWECVDEIFQIPDLSKKPDLLYAVSYLLRSRRVDRIVALDDFDVEVAADLREHLRLAGMGHSVARHFRDKLAMRVTAQANGLKVPAFSPILNYDQLRHFLQTVPPPWVLKPRSEAGAVGIRKLHDAESVWRTLDELGDKQSFYLLEQFVVGDVFHVDSVIWNGELAFAQTSQYGRPPMAVSHGGGVFSSWTVPAQTPESTTLTEMTRQIIRAFGMVHGVNHAEYIRGDADGQFYFLENAARVAGANLDKMVAAATGVELWAEAARVEVASVKGEAYHVPQMLEKSAGILTCLARHERPNLAVYDDPEVVWRLHKPYHASLIVASPNPQRVQTLLGQYTDRFIQDFLAIAPPKQPTRV